MGKWFEQRPDRCLGTILSENPRDPGSPVRFLNINFFIFLLVGNTAYLHF